MRKSKVFDILNEKIEKGEYSYIDFYNRAYRYFMIRDYESAIKDLDKSIKENYDDDGDYFCKAYNLKCFSYVCLKKYKNALETIDKFISNENINSYINDSTYYHKAFSLFRLNKFEEALENINLAISIEDNKIILYDLKVNILYKLNMLETNI